MQSYIHFTLVERENLRIKLLEGNSLRQIAQALNRNVSSISRELKRHGKKDGSYNAWWGCSLYLWRRKNCRKKFRINNDLELTEFISSRLNKYWSPETITVKWKELHPNAKLSHSTIYAALKSNRLAGYSERTHLLRHGRLKFCRNANNPIHPEHNIREWPEIIKCRDRLGDWEGDTIRGGVGKGYIVTCVDRKSRYLAMSLLPFRTAPETKVAVCEALSGLPVHSLTLDNGTEFADFKGIEKALNIVVYFADPHTPWQRGSNENMNGLLRFFFPKGSDLRQVTQERLNEVADLLNSRPRKCLGWLTPSDFLAKCCT